MMVQEDPIKVGKDDGLK